MLKFGGFDEMEAAAEAGVIGFRSKFGSH